MEAVQLFLDSLSISSRSTPIEDLHSITENALHIFCLQTAAEADIFLEKFAGRNCERQLLVIEPSLPQAESEGELSSFVCVRLGSGFATGFFEALASKIARLAHNAKQAPALLTSSSAASSSATCSSATVATATSASSSATETALSYTLPYAASTDALAATAALPKAAMPTYGASSSEAGEVHATDVEIAFGEGDLALFPGLRAAEAALSSLLREATAPPPTPVGRRTERKSYEVGPFSGLLTRGEVLPLGNTTVKVSHTNHIVGLGLPLSAYRTVGWSATLLTAFCALLIALIALEVMTGSTSFGSALSLPCYGVVLLGSTLLGSFAFLRPPTRCGRLLALQALRRPEAFAFMVSYQEASAERAHSLATMLSRAGASVWLDTYRLENAFNVKHAVYCAARDAGFVVLLVTPKYLLSSNRCLELLAALRRPREQVFVWVDGAADWATAAGGQLSESGDACEVVREWLAAQGFRVVTTSMVSLLKALDEALMSQEEYHAEWWRRQPATEDLSLHTNLTNMYVNNTSGRPAKRVSLPLMGGRCTVPTGAVSSGLHVLSRDGSRCEPLINSTRSSSEAQEFEPARCPPPSLTAAIADRRHR